MSEKENVDKLIENFANEHNLNTLLCKHARMAIAKHEYKSTSQEKQNMCYKFRRMLIIKNETTTKNIEMRKKVIEDKKHEEQQQKEQKPSIQKDAKRKYLKSIINKNKNWKTKYKTLLNENSEQKLNEIILKHDTVQELLQKQAGLNFGTECFDDFMTEVRIFLEHIDKYKDEFENEHTGKISKFCALSLISAFAPKSLDNYQIEQILVLVDENLTTRLDGSSGTYLFARKPHNWTEQDNTNIFDVLAGPVPEKFIKYVIDCIDFDKCKDDEGNYYLLEVVYNLILHDPYSNENFKQAIKNVLIDGEKYEEFRKKLFEVQDFGKYTEENLKEEQLGPIEQLRKKLSDENLALRFENGKFEIEYTKKLLWLRLAYVFLFIVAFVALPNVWLSFLAVPKIASWIAFGICFAGGSVCAFFAYWINSLKRQRKPKYELDLQTLRDEEPETAVANNESPYVSNNLEENANGFSNDFSYEKELLSIN